MANYAYPSTGEIGDAAGRRIVGTLEDDQRARVVSEHLLEIDVAGGVPIRSGEQPFEWLPSQPL